VLPDVLIKNKFGEIIDREIRSIKPDLSACFLYALRQKIYRRAKTYE
jgi:hypothetical protein